ncbi:hypothetical protein MNO14_00405 [Luteimonas sp. S4-F44]|uniref:hypothetical protein n=1 Tax=Luteimonas sp. S4-F44 TaxID=2925842 RepID=UPI001F52CC56|nr:hypothetical protein [Luteimonas sp. S4-F44]UNK42607.1 hypothetical protein MNO14_00405 [Luteimonas sp. S4-F44]
MSRLPDAERPANGGLHASPEPSAPLAPAVDACAVAAYLNRVPASVTVRFEEASVVVQANAALCGNGAGFNGRYQPHQ